jgi:4-hydroxy-3-polyprenylbenzoate decarboxylase
MPFADLQAFLAHLEATRQLQRVRVEVDPVLEAGEIAQRVLRDGGPALLFERPKGASMPLLMNLFGTMDRVRTALGRDPEGIGEQLVQTVQRLNPPSLSALWQNRGMLAQLRHMRPARVSSGVCQEVSEKPDLSSLPILKCWPRDGGRFITFGMVITHNPRTRVRNLGLYRLQMFNNDQTGMHWQSMKGGRGHYWEAEQRGEDLEVAVVIGADPILMMSSILPLPEDVDEVGFAGFLRGKRVPMVRAKTLNMDVPASAEIILEGVVPAKERRMEGPFGDHFGHYSEAAEFPVFHIRRVTRRRNSVYAATVVGKPPQEDKFLGLAAGAMVGPLIKLIHPNVVDLAAYVGAGFHNLLVASVKERHPKEVLKTAMALLGTGQLSLTKVLVLVDAECDPRDFHRVLREIGQRFDPENHMWLLPFAPLDTLDFTSFTMHVGSKLVIDACGPILRQDPNVLPMDFGRLDPRIEKWKLLDGGFLVFTVRDGGRAVVENVVAARPNLRFAIAVSPDVDLDDDENLQWGIFTRFDPARDMVVSEQKFVGARPVYRGIIGIDATWKRGYPLPLEMDESIVKQVDSRWGDYWK